MTKEVFICLEAVGFAYQCTVNIMRCWSILLLNIDQQISMMKYVQVA